MTQIIQSTIKFDIILCSMSDIIAFKSKRIYINYIWEFIAMPKAMSKRYATAVSTKTFLPCQSDILTMFFNQQRTILHNVGQKS